MSQLKNYTGSVYGGLGHLLKAYYETKILKFLSNYNKSKILNVLITSFGVTYLKILIV